MSVDGVRQDFVIEMRPAGNGTARLSLELDGAEAETMAGGARLVLADGGRKLAYSRLKATDARRSKVNARLEVLSPHRLVVVLDDAFALYPVRIDPTFSDANGTGFGGTPGTSGAVDAAVVDGSGNLYIGGGFTLAADTSASHVAEWNGSTWSGLGSGVNSLVQALAVSGTDAFATGFFSKAGGVTANGIAKWDGGTWSPLGSKITGGDALALAGNVLYVGGPFFTAGTNISAYIAEAVLSTIPFIITTNGDFGFTNHSSFIGFDVSGSAGDTHVVLGSTNLSDWLPLQTNLLTSPVWYFTDPGSGSLDRRFYRVELAP